MQFFEPEKEFKLKKTAKKNVNTRARALFLFLILLLTVIWAVDNDFAVALEKGKIKQKCFYSNRYTKSDNNKIIQEKANNALKDHLKSIEKLTGFIKARLILNNNQKIPEIEIIFEKDINKKNRIPETICGFKTIIKEQ